MGGDNFEGVQKERSAAVKLKTIFKACQSLCDKRIREKPQAGIIVDGEKVPYTELKDSLKRLQDWCYPMDTNALKV